MIPNSRTSLKHNSFSVWCTGPIRRLQGIEVVCNKYMHSTLTGLRDWGKDDDPWTEHARYSEHCHFLHYSKGEEFVQLVRVSESVVGNIFHIV